MKKYLVVLAVLLATMARSAYADYATYTFQMTNTGSAPIYYALCGSSEAPSMLALSFDGERDRQSIGGELLAHTTLPITVSVPEDYFNYAWAPRNANYILCFGHSLSAAQRSMNLPSVQISYVAVRYNSQYVPIAENTITLGNMEPGLSGITIQDNQVFIDPTSAYFYY